MPLSADRIPELPYQKLTRDLPLNGESLIYDAALGKLVFGGGGGGNGSSTFLGLLDTPLAFGTVGQVPAVNSAGDALEFIDVAAGGGGGGDAVAYSAPLEDIASATYGTATHILNLGTEVFNLGSFTVDDTLTTDRIVIPSDGLYELILSVHVVSDNRTVVTGQFTLDNGTDPEAAIVGQGTGYARGLSTENFSVAEHAHFAQLSAGDKVGVTLVSSNSSVSVSIVGASSSIQVIKSGGGQGIDGVDGVGVPVGGTIGQVLGKTSALDYATGWVDQTGGGGTDTNDYVDAFTAALSGQVLSLTLGRTGALGDLTQQVTFPTFGGGGGSSTWLDLTDTPAAFGTPGQLSGVDSQGTGLAFFDPQAAIPDGSAVRTNIASFTSSATVGAAVEVTLSADLASGQLLDFFVGSPGYAVALSDAILGKPAQSAIPTDVTTAVGLKIVNNTEWDTESLYVWRGSTADKIYVAINRNASASCSIYSIAGLGGGGADNFVGARAGISPARTGQNYGTLTTITWDTEEFDVGGFFDPSSNSRMTVPSGVTYAVVHAGVTLGGFANTGDLFIDIIKNGVSLGIGSTTKNIGISTVARTSVTTGVVEVAEGDYFELAIRVVQDGSVSLQPIGTFFSCHASSTEIGGSSPDTNDYVSSIDFGLSGQDVTLTLDRTGPLASISGTFTIPAGGGTGTDTNDYVTAGAFSLSGQDLSLQLTGTSGFPAIDIPAITLPAGGGGTDTNDYVDSFLAAVSGSDLTMTLGRTGALADLTQTVALPAGGGGTTTTDRQRIEALAFTAVGTTTTDSSSSRHWVPRRRA